MDMRPSMALLVIVSLFFLLSACTSGYKQFYNPLPRDERIARVGPPPASVLVEYALRFEGDDQAREFFRRYLTRGFAPIGVSSFISSRSESESGAIEQAKEVGADLVVILQPAYRGTSAVSLPLTLPTVTNTYSSGHATGYGPGGPVTVYGTARAATYGSQIAYIPIVRHHIEYGAVYFVRAQLPLGLAFRKASESERAALGTNKGAVVDIVVENGPAFEADILAGDVLVAIDEVGVATPEHAINLLVERRGREVNLVFVRNGQRIDKKLPVQM